MNESQSVAIFFPPHHIVRRLFFSFVDDKAKRRRANPSEKFFIFLIFWFFHNHLSVSFHCKFVDQLPCSRLINPSLKCIKIVTNQLLTSKFKIEKFSERKKWNRKKVDCCYNEGDDDDGNNSNNEHRNLPYEIRSKQQQQHQQQHNCYFSSTHIWFVYIFTLRHRHHHLRRKIHSRVFALLRLNWYIYNKVTEIILLCEKIENFFLVSVCIKIMAN